VQHLGQHIGTHTFCPFGLRVMRAGRAVMSRRQMMFAQDVESSGTDCGAFVGVPLALTNNQQNGASNS
jgi:hypothetical protein